MKVIIDIPNEILEDIKNCFCGEHYGDFRKLAIAIGNGTPIPENATNGERFLITHPEAHVFVTGEKRVGVVLVKGEQEGCPCAFFNKKWWYAPYKNINKI